MSCLTRLLLPFALLYSLNALTVVQTPQACVLSPAEPFAGERTV